jgi:hypothetical protein
VLSCSNEIIYCVRSNLPHQRHSQLMPERKAAARRVAFNRIEDAVDERNALGQGRPRSPDLLEAV